MAEKPPVITEPVRVDPKALIHNVYADTAGAPDEHSQGEFSTYLVERMYGKDDEVARKYRPGYEIPRPKLFFDGWLIKPRTAVIATLAGLAAVNIAYNVRSIFGKIGETGGDVIHMVDPQTRTVSSTEHEHQTVTTTENFPINTSGQEQASGVAERDTVSAAGLVAKLRVLKAKDEIKSITITGNASDEWAGNGVKSVGQPDPQNRELSLDRAERFSQSVEQVAKEKGVDIPDIQVKAKEHVLDHQQLGEFLADVQESKYASVIEAISAYNSGDKTMSNKLRSEIKEMIGSQRKDIASVKVQETIIIPHTTTTRPEHEVEVPRKDSKHPVQFIPFLIPPIPRLGREYRDPFVRPPIIRDEPLDKVWIELYEEAQKKSGEVVSDAWAYTRKYQALYREERITQCLRYDYTDDDGESQSIDILFTDRPELDEGTIEAINGLMLDISLMQRGKVAEKLDAIVVVPSEQTGPQRPDKIGLGIDEQLHQNVLGVAIPLIGLVELQLPQKPTSSEIEDFNGMRWTFAHEVAGHFTDVNDDSRVIRKAKSNRPGRTFTAENPWSGAGEDGFNGIAQWVEVQQFSIPHPEAEEGEYIVNPGDDELKDADEARLRGQSPTSYGATSPEELHAETAAAVVTDILIPAGEAGLDDEVLGDKEGYSVDAGLQHRFASHVGALTNTETLAWEEKRAAERRASFGVTVLSGTVELNDDADQNHASETAKNQPYQPDPRRLKILARARR